MINVFNKKTKYCLPETLIVAAITIAGYLVAFFYEAGYANYFHIPIEFISISLTSVFIATMNLILVLMIVWTPWAVLSLAFPLISRFFLGKPLRILKIIIGCLVLTLLILIIWRNWAILGPLIEIIAPSVLIGIILRIIRWAKSKLPNNINNQPIINTDQLFNKPEDFIVKAVMTLIPLVIFAWIIGYGHAWIWNEFLIRGSPPSEYVVLRIYGDNLICAPLDRENGKIEVKPNFWIIKANSDTTKLKVMTIKDLRRAPIGSLPP